MEKYQLNYTKNKAYSFVRIGALDNKSFNQILSHFKRAQGATNFHYVLYFLYNELILFRIIEWALDKNIAEHSLVHACNHMYICFGSHFAEYLTVHVVFI